MPQQFRRYQIFQRAAYAFEHGDVFPTAPALLLAADEFMQIGDDVICRNRIFFSGDRQLSRLEPHWFLGVDDDAGALDGVRVRFASVRLECPDEIEMSSGAEVAAVE